MARLVVKTVLRALGVLVVILFTTFLVGHVIGDPARLAVPLTAPEEDYQRMRELLGLNDPFLTQLGNFASQVASLDFGESLWQQRPALGVALERLPATITLIGASFVIALVVGGALGVVAAMRQGSWIDRLVSAFNTVAAATPPFWIGIVLILVFAVHFKVFPTSGSDGLGALVLPAVTLSLASLGRISQTVRSSLLAEARRPYARLARAKGLSPSRILSEHTSRNAGVAIATFSLWELVRLVTGAGVVVEVVFGWPGIGQLAIESVQQQDFPLMQACVLVVTVLVVIINFGAELLYGILDPRLRNPERVVVS